MKKTGILPPDVKPVRSGVYETRTVNVETGRVNGPWLFSWFDATDRIWGCGHQDAEAAWRVPDYEFAFQNKQWRGLTEEQAEAGAAKAQPREKT